MKTTNTFVRSVLVLDNTVALSIYFCKEFNSYGMVAMNTNAVLVNWGGFVRIGFDTLEDLFTHMIEEGSAEAKNELARREKVQAVKDLNWTVERARAHMIERMQNEG